MEKRVCATFVGAAWLFWLGLAVPAGGRSGSPTDQARLNALEALLFLANQYVVAYEQSFSGLVAEEHYEQWVADANGRVSRTRALRSDYLLVMAEESASWRGFRDVFEVDGRPVRDRSRRLMSLLMDPPKGARRQLERIASESARYNIGRVTRTFNLPLMPLTFLDPLNQHRFRFEHVGRESIEGVGVDVVRYAEHARPTIIQTRTGDVFAYGRFWLEPGSGRVLRTELMAGNANIRVKAAIVTDYVRDEGVDLWVPSRMRETYEDPGREGSDVIHGLATYTRYRRFTVSTEYEVR